MLGFYREAEMDWFREACMARYLLRSMVNRIC